MEFQRAASKHGVQQDDGLHFDDGRDIVIHAMPMRTLYQDLLPNHGDPT
ncbi:MAG: hypothetical protein F2873_06850 [Actinobacteria bacterium]|nr:hypothetical protein [Actinomycetota bacterium]MSX79755.1 hypothetical protein [Actinomycetota bacterium]